MSLLAKWAEVNTRPIPGLIVIHSHAHGITSRAINSFRVCRAYSSWRPNLPLSRRLWEFPNGRQESGKIDLGDRVMEHPLDLTRAHVFELEAAFEQMKGTLQKVPLPDFTVVPGSPRLKSRLLGALGPGPGSDRRQIRKMGRLKQLRSPFPVPESNLDPVAVIMLFDALHVGLQGNAARAQFHGSRNRRGLFGFHHGSRAPDLLEIHVAGLPVYGENPEIRTQEALHT